jgi:hypothetical protein
MKFLTETFCVNGYCGAVVYPDLGSDLEVEVEVQEKAYLPDSDQISVHFDDVKQSRNGYGKTRGGGFQVHPSIPGIHLGKYSISKNQEWQRGTVKTFRFRDRAYAYEIAVGYDLQEVEKHLKLKKNQLAKTPVLKSKDIKTCRKLEKAGIDPGIEWISEEEKLCSENYVYFVNNHFKTQHFRKGIIPFKMYGYQERLFYHLEKEKWTILAKFRQGGFTNTALAWALCKCIWEPHSSVLMLTKTDREAIATKGVVDFFMSQLPTSINRKISRSTAHEIEFDNGSHICVQSPHATRGKSANLLIIDEAAFINDMREHWTAVYPVTSSSKDGKTIVLSTPKKGSWFNQTYKDAKEGKNSFKVFETNYLEHPDYADKEWVKEMKKQLGPSFKEEVLAKVY